MSLHRLLKSCAWKLMPYASVKFESSAGLHLPMKTKGDWGSINEIFMQNAYAAFWPHLENVRRWVDLGANAGCFSLALLNQLYSIHGKDTKTKAILGDANELCVKNTRNTLALNNLSNNWDIKHVVVGPRDTVVEFKQFKFSIHSGIFSTQKPEKTFHYATTNVPDLVSNYDDDYFDLIKIDIEGAEKYLFNQDADFVKRFRYGLCEWHAPEFDGEMMRTFCERMNFEILHAESQPVRDAHKYENCYTAPIGMVLWKNKNIPD